MCALYSPQTRRVHLFRPCYVARVSATLPLVEEGKFRPCYVARVGATLPLVEEGKLAPLLIPPGGTRRLGARGPPHRDLTP